MVLKTFTWFPALHVYWFKDFLLLADDCSSKAESEQEDKEIEGSRVKATQIKVYKVI